MRKWRRRRLRFGVLAVIAAAVAGCGSASATTGGWPPLSKGPVHLNVLMVSDIVYSDSQIDQMTHAFEVLHPNIKVSTEFVAYNALHQKIITDQIGGSGIYDVVVMDNIWPAEFASAGIARNLKGRIPASYLTDTLPGVWQGSTYHGGIYGVPWGGMAVKHLFYNKKMLAEAGIQTPPRTWNQLETDAETLKAKHIVQYPFVASWGQCECAIADWTQMAGAFGAKKLMNENGTPAFNTGGGLASLTFMRTMMAKGLANPGSLSFDEEDVNSTMESGQAAMALNWDYFYPEDNSPADSKVAGQIALTISPGEGSVPTSGVDGDLSLAVTKSSAHPAEALEYALYMSSETVQNEGAAVAPPMWKASYKDPKVTDTDPPVYAAYEKLGNHIIERPQVPYYSALSAALQVAIQKALAGSETPKQALDSVAAQIPSLKKNG